MDESKTTYEPKKKKPFFDREFQQYIVLGTFYVLLATVSQVDLAGTAWILFGATAGMGIYKHGLKIVEVNINKYVEKDTGEIR